MKDNNYKFNIKEIKVGQFYVANETGHSEFLQASLELLYSYSLQNRLHCVAMLVLHLWMG